MVIPSRHCSSCPLPCSPASRKGFLTWWSSLDTLRSLSESALQHTAQFRTTNVGTVGDNRHRRNERCATAITLRSHEVLHAMTAHACTCASRAERTRARHCVNGSAANSSHAHARMHAHARTSVQQVALPHVVFWCCTVGVGPVRVGPDQVRMCCDAHRLAHSLTHSGTGNRILDTDRFERRERWMARRGHHALKKRELGWPAEGTTL